MDKRVVFEDPESGKILQVSNEVGVELGFCSFKSCESCLINNKTEDDRIEACTNWVLEHPQEAGELMGYRVVAVQDLDEEKEKDNCEENKNQNEASKPFLLHYLGVEPDELFEIEGDEKDYLVNDKGKLMMENQALLGGWILAPLVTVYRVLDNPGLVKKKTKLGLNEEELKTLRMVRDLVPGVKTMGLNRATDEIVFWDEKGVLHLKMPRLERFPVLDKVWEVDVEATLERGWVEKK